MSNKLTSQDLITIRDAADYLVDVHEDLAYDLQEVGDRLAEYLKLVLDTEPRYLSVYEVTRHYGGPEEGGWWYNLYDLVTTVHVPPHEDLEEVRDQLQAKYGDLAQGDIYSVLGGVAVSVVVESTPGEHQSTGRPTYA